MKPIREIGLELRQFSLKLYISHNLMWYVCFRTSICIPKFPHIKQMILVTKFPQSQKNFRDPGSPRSQLFLCLSAPSARPWWCCFICVIYCPCPFISTRSWSSFMKWKPLFFYTWYYDENQSHPTNYQTDIDANH